MHKRNRATVGARITGDQALIARDTGSYKCIPKAPWVNL